MALAGRASVLFSFRHGSRKNSAGLREKFRVTLRSANVEMEGVPGDQ
jgi:hypothetical protein